MLYHAGTVYFGQRHGFSRLQSREYRGEPFLEGPKSLAAIPPFPFSPVRFSQLMLLLFPLFQQGQAAEAPIKHTLSLLKKGRQIELPAYVVEMVMKRFIFSCMVSLMDRACQHGIDDK